MKPLATITLSTLAATAASRAILGPDRSATLTTSSHLLALHLHDFQSFNATANLSTAVTIDAPSALSDPPDDEWGLDSDPDDDEEEDEDEDDSLTREQKDQIWCKAKSRGIQLTKAMMLDDASASTLLQWPYTESPWDGDLKTELRTWGTHEVGDAFREMGVDPKSVGKGGPNHCFYVEHMNGANVLRDEDGELPFEEEQYYVVDGKKYRVTQGYAKIGINPIDGLVYFIHRQSPEDAAQEHWQRKPSSDELPALRASSDIAWGMWNRVAQGSTRINYFMAVQIINPQTQSIMSRALEQFNIDAVPPWPGKTFDLALRGKDPQGDPNEADLLELESALALLGSPNGLATGYFLLQHRRQLGWKYISKVRIWSAGSGVWANPNILFYVSDRAVFEGTEGLDELLERLRVAQRRKRGVGRRDGGQGGVREGFVWESRDGRNVVREHVVMARL